MSAITSVLLAVSEHQQADDPECANFLCPACLLYQLSPKWLDEVMPWHDIACGSYGAPDYEGGDLYGPPGSQLTSDARAALREAARIEVLTGAVCQ